jgi:hypothetical protein
MGTGCLSFRLWFHAISLLITSSTGHGLARLHTDEKVINSDPCLSV